MAIYEYLLYNRTDQESYTFFDNIQKLPHGACGVVKNKTLAIRKWYVLEEELKKPFANPAEFYEALKQSLTFRLRSDVPVGVCLSGGLDSSSIVSILLKEFNKNDLNTFSAVYGKGEKADESSFIDAYRSKLEKMHFTYPTAKSFIADFEQFIECHSEPVAALGPYAQFKVMQLAREHVVVTLDGQGADEELAGYHYFFGSYFKQLLKGMRLRKLLSEISSYISNHHSSLAFRYFFLYMMPPVLKDVLVMDNNHYIMNNFYRYGRKLSNIKNDLYHPVSLNESLLQHFHYKLEHLLKWEDHNSMWHSIESRVPFLDHNIVERTLTLPSNKIISNATTKYILREAMCGVLPEKIRKRKDKMGFETPWDKWCKTDKFVTLITDLLNSIKFRQRGYLNSEKCIQAYQSQLNGKINISKEIWKWVSLELWFRKFIDN